MKRNRSDSQESSRAKSKKSRSKSRKKRRKNSSSSSSDEEKRRCNRRSGSRDTRRKSKKKKSKKDKFKTSQEYSNSDDDVEIIKEPDRKPELERGLLFKDLIKHPIKEKSQEAPPEQQHYPAPAPSSDSGFGAFTSTISAPEPEPKPEPAPTPIPKPVPKPTQVPTLSLFCNLCQFKSEDRMAREEHMTEPNHQKNMLRMGQDISEFIKKHKNLNKLINIKSTYWKPEKEIKPEARKMPVEKAKEPEPDVIVVMEAEPEIEVLDPRKAPFLYTSHLMVCFDVKLTDASVASEIYQVSKSRKTMTHNDHLFTISPSRSVPGPPQVSSPPISCLRAKLTGTSPSRAK